MLHQIDRQLGRLAGLFAVAGSLGIVILLGVTVVAVFWRYMLNAPIFGIEDISIVTLTLVAAGSVAYGARHGAHVAINVISGLFGRRVLRVTDAIMRALVAGICLLSAYALVVKACGIEKACITSNLSLEHQPYFYVLAAAMALIGLNALVQLLIGLLYWSEAKDPYEVAE